MSVIYLIPNTLGENNFDKIFPAYNKEIISRLRVFAVENIKTARRLIAALGLREIIDQSEFIVLNNKTNPQDVLTFLHQNKAKNIGVVSEAGCPGIADPGADLVRFAHQNGFKVEPLVGPSSILLALIASGLNGQNFSFTGYLPKQQNERVRKIKQLEQKVLKENQTQLFIETPYRVQHMLDDLLKHLHPETLLCVAKNITMTNQMIKTLPVAEWKSENIDLNKQQVIFCIGR
ncbi:MAG TPA: SAM-dependent methyltransferase [Flavobacteriales bacterium]|nr:SAM-dependent methyltransferase [Flavobacteriales bacterium]|tara:strand:+ start:58766 stop:59464 length:699 start_codon:yes stop_codon:yes gene_type:complete